MEEKPTSRNIPLPVQREVRQRCGFGCVICGLPLYEYEHLLGWSNVKRHVAEEITLLCNQHHREKTSGLLPIKKVIEANSHPFNLKVGVSKPYDLHYEGDKSEVVIGSNSFVSKYENGEGSIFPIIIDNIPLISFTLLDGHLLLNLNLFDEYNKLVLKIVNNQLIYSLSPWDIQFVGQKIIIREKSRKILIDINFEVPNRIILNRGRFLLNGVEILLNGEYLEITNNTTLISGNTFNCPCGIMIGQNNTGCGVGIHIENLSRYNGDNADTLKWLKEVFE